MSSCLLASCATLSTHLPLRPAPPKPPPYVCAAAPAEPALPADAGLVKPATDAERVAVKAFLDWAYQWGDWGRALAARVAKTSAWCAGLTP